MAESPEESGRDLESSEAQEYFRRVEEVFVELRGAPMLLSPKDWQVARSWYERGIPVDHVERALREVFERRLEGGAKGRVQSLGYCRDAVEASWQEIEELTSLSVRRPAPGLDVAARLAEIADRLPESLPQRERWRRRVLALEGEAETVERGLAGLEEELLAAAWDALPEGRREAVTAEVEKALARLAERLDAEQRRTAARRVREARLRREVGLPRLTLFGAGPDSDAD